MCKCDDITSNEVCSGCVPKFNTIETLMEQRVSLIKDINVIIQAECDASRLIEVLKATDNLIVALSGRGQ